MTGRRILVVEAAESLRRVSQAQLEQAGYRAVTAADGCKALAILEKRPREMVIADLMMPKFSGLGIRKRIHTDHLETIMILVTSFATAESALQAMKMAMPPLSAHSRFQPSTFFQNPATGHTSTPGCQSLALEVR